MKELIASAASFILLASASLARGDDAPTYTVVIDLGVALPLSDWYERSHQEIFLPVDPGQDYSPGPGVSFGGFVTGRIAGPLEWRAEIGHDRVPPSEDLKSTCEFIGTRCVSSLTRFGGGVQLSGGNEQLSAYGFVTFGAYKLGSTNRDGETVTGLAFGGGANVNVGEGMFIGFGLALRNVFECRGCVRPAVPLAPLALHDSFERTWTIQETNHSEHTFERFTDAR